MYEVFFVILCRENQTEYLIMKYDTELTCVAFMGGDASIDSLNDAAMYLKNIHPNLKVAWYSGRQQFPRTIRKRDFDYIKLGPYIEHLGCLKERTTNQRLYKRAAGDDFTDITSRFWKK